MREIFINGRFLSQPITGAQRYAHELLRALDVLLSELPAGYPKVTVLVPAAVSVRPRYLHLGIRHIGVLGGQLWEQLELPLHARKGLLFTPCGGAPLTHRRNIITIHDAAVIAAPQGYSRTFRAWYQALNWALCHTARHLLTVSNFSRAELVRWYGARESDITVTYLGSEHALRPEPDPEVLSRNRLDKGQYVFMVGSRSANKNLAGLIAAAPYLKDSGLQIAVAGHRDATVFGQWKQEHDQVRDLGYVSESELRTLYENAACFVFPSFYEGFGLPPLEALALGCPVVVSFSSALKEVFSGKASFCDPSDAGSIAAAILEACRTPREQRAENQSFAQMLHWSACAQTTWQLLCAASREEG